MAASDALSGQMRAYIPAGHLADPERVSHDDRAYYNTHEEMVGDKLALARGLHLSDAKRDNMPLYESIREFGVTEPVTVEMRTDYKTKEPGIWLADGHHRVFSAADIDPHMPVPIKWD